jgi:hypothetical protein
MAINVAIGRGIFEGSVGTVNTHTGLGFQPKALVFWSLGISSTTDIAFAGEKERFGIGYATSTADRCCVGAYGINAAAAADTQEIVRNDAVLGFPTNTGAVGALLDIDTITTDGFTLVVDDEGDSLGITPMTYGWVVLGGSDITAASTGSISEPAATGVVSYTAGAGFLPTLAFFGGCQLTGAVPAAAVIDSGIMFGAASGTGAGNQFVFTMNSDEGSATMDVDKYLRFDECLAMIAPAGGNPSARASFNGFDSLGFDLNWTARATTARKYIYLAIAAGSNVKVGKIAGVNLGTINNIATVSGLAFSPVGGMIVGSAIQESTSATSSTDGQCSIGAFTTTNRFALSLFDEDATAAAEISAGLSTDEVYQLLTATGTVAAEVDYQATTADGFTLVVDDELAATTVDLAYVVFGGEWMPAWLPRRGSDKHMQRRRR